MSKKILFTVTNDLTYDQRMQRICTSLAQNGFKIEHIGIKLPHSAALEQRNFKQKRIHCIFKKGKLFYFEYNLKLFFYLFFKKFDAACAIDLDTILPVLLVSKIKNKKSIYDAHEYFTEIPEIQGRDFVKKIWLKIEAFALPKIDKCYTVSYSISRELKNKYNKDFGLIRNVPFFRPNIDKKTNKKFILYQGALNKGRGLETLIDIICEIDLDLWIVGEGELSSELRERAKKSRGKEKIIFLGYIKPNELKEITPKAFLGYNLLEDIGLSYYYSLSNKFFDYIQAGVPVITNDFPEYKKINDKFDLAIFSKLEKKDLIENINKIVANKDEYKKLQKNCLVAKRQFNWENEKEKLFEIYNSLW